MFNNAHRLIPTAWGHSGRADWNPAQYGTLWVIIAALLALATLLLPGCSNPGTAHAVDSPRARDALKSALDEWKKGQGPKSLESSSTPVVVQDVDWAAGAKLIDYQLVDDGMAEDANLRVRVKLTMSGGQPQGKTAGKTAEKSVWYLVTTSPKVTVFRDMLRH
jgi:hypothetical protein